jgi:hypothetical protein
MNYFYYVDYDYKTDISSGNIKRYYNLPFTLQSKLKTKLWLERTRGGEVNINVLREVTEKIMKDGEKKEIQQLKRITHTVKPVCNCN